jgi:hypothetical protein
MYSTVREYDTETAITDSRVVNSPKTGHLQALSRVVDHAIGDVGISRHSAELSTEEPDISRHSVAAEESSAQDGRDISKLSTFPIQTTSTIANRRDNSK